MTGQRVVLAKAGSEEFEGLAAADREPAMARSSGFFETL
jgi:hypothetical protein